MIIAATATEERKGTFLTYHGPFEESIPRMAACGYEAAELHILDSAEIDRKKLWEILRQNHIRLTSVGTGSVYGQRHYNLVDSRRKVRGGSHPPSGRAYDHGAALRRPGDCGTDCRAA